MFTGSHWETLAISNMAVCARSWGIQRVETVCGKAHVQEQIVVFVRKWCLSACDFYVWAQRTWFSYSSTQTELRTSFPEVCVVRWLSLQYVCWYIRPGDTLRWRTVTPSDRHSRDSQAWECPQSKPWANYSYSDICNYHQGLLKFKCYTFPFVFFSVWETNGNSSFYNLSNFHVNK